MTQRPPSIIVERLGEANAARLSQIMGGTRVHVPSSPAAGARLKRLLGEHLAVLLILHFGDSQLSVPNGKRPGTRVKVSAVRVARLTDRGWSSNRIAKRLGCSVRTVHKKRAEARNIITTKEMNCDGRDI